jgi:hypothetical protein
MGLLRNLFGKKSDAAPDGSKNADRSGPGSHTESQPKPAGTTRSGDGTILGDTIKKKLYTRAAGSESIGYFHPEVAPFRTFPNGKTGLMQGPMADLTIQSMRASGGIYGSMFDESGDISVDIARKLGLRSVREVMATFQEVVKDEQVAIFLLVTTTMPFFLTYSSAKAAIISEVDYEMKLNALAYLLMKDPGFSSVKDVFEFRKKAGALLTERAEEVETKKQWAIDLQRSRNA